jgi:hypothetical protein
MKMRTLVIFAVALIAWAPRAWAQALPILLTVEWDANPAGDEVQFYTVTLDSDSPITVGLPACSPRESGGVVICRQVVEVKTAGAHLFSVRAVNAWLTSEPGTASVTVLLPSPVKQIRITKTK